MTITGGTALPRDEIDRMVKEAEQFADEDHKRRVDAEARNQADNLVYQTEKMVAEHGDKLPDADRSEIEAAINECKEALKGSDTSAITASMEKLNTAAQKIGQAMYAQQQSAGQQAAAAGGSAEGDVVDAEIVDEEEAK